MDDSSKSDSVLPCIFNMGVLCSFVKSHRFRPMERCFRCKEYERWKRRMDEADDAVMDAIDREQEELEFEKFESEMLKYRKR